MKLAFFSSIVCCVMYVLVGCDSLHPTPPSIFQEPYAVQSPNGSVPFGASAISPDSTRYAREVAPQGQGYIGVYRRADSAILCQFDVLPGNTNDLKGLAWARDSRHLAVMYHWSAGASIDLFDADSGGLERRVATESSHVTNYHFMAFSRNNAFVCLSDNRQTTADSLPSGLDTLDRPMPRQPDKRGL